VRRFVGLQFKIVDHLAYFANFVEFVRGKRR
jgi:hypothetical protein